MCEDSVFDLATLQKPRLCTIVLDDWSELSDVARLCAHVSQSRHVDVEDIWCMLCCCRDPAHLSMRPTDDSYRDRAKCGMPKSPVLVASSWSLPLVRANVGAGNPPTKKNRR